MVGPIIGATLLLALACVGSVRSNTHEVSLRGMRRLVSSASQPLCKNKTPEECVELKVANFTLTKCTDKTAAECEKLVAIMREAFTLRAKHCKGLSKAKCQTAMAATKDDDRVEAKLETFKKSNEKCKADLTGEPCRKLLEKMRKMFQMRQQLCKGKRKDECKSIMDKCKGGSTDPECSPAKARRVESLSSLGQRKLGNSPSQPLCKDKTPEECVELKVANFTLTKCKDKTAAECEKLVANMRQAFTLRAKHCKGLGKVECQKAMAAAKPSMAAATPSKEDKRVDTKLEAFKKVNEKCKTDVTGLACKNLLKKMRKMFEMREQLCKGKSKDECKVVMDKCTGGSTDPECSPAKARRAESLSSLGPRKLGNSPSQSLCKNKTPEECVELKVANFTLTKCKDKTAAECEKLVANMREAFTLRAKHCKGLSKAKCQTAMAAAKEQRWQQRPLSERVEAKLETFRKSNEKCKTDLAGEACRNLLEKMRKMYHLNTR